MCFTFFIVLLHKITLFDILNSELYLDCFIIFVLNSVACYSRHKLSLLSLLFYFIYFICINFNLIFYTVLLCNQVNLKLPAQQRLAFNLCQYPVLVSLMLGSQACVTSLAVLFEAIRYTTIDYFTLVLS